MDGTVVGRAGPDPSDQSAGIDIPPGTEAAAVEDAVCRGNIPETESGASFLEIAPLARRTLIQIAAEHPQPAQPGQPGSRPLPAWRSVLRELGRALQEGSAPPAGYPSSPPATGQPVYSPSECVGVIVMGVCHGAILPNQATHPVCHGQMLDGVCTGPMF
jgi:hypothetical protein